MEEEAVGVGAVDAAALAALVGELTAAMAVLRDCAARGGQINPALAAWFEGYAKACDDIACMVSGYMLNGEPLPERYQPRNECPECKRT